MRRITGGFSVGLACVLLWAGMMVALHGCTGGAGTAIVPSSAGSGIEYIVVILQENRTPDNLFHGLPNADIADSGLNSAGETISLTSIGLSVPFDLGHSHAAFVAMYDNGKMDGADKIGIQCQPKKPDCPPPNPQFHYVDSAEVRPYFAIAEQYSFADRMFQTNQGPSFPAHQFVIAGTSAPTATSDLFAAENVGFPVNAGSNMEAGCAGPPGETVAMIDPRETSQPRSFHASSIRPWWICWMLTKSRNVITHPRPDRSGRRQMRFTTCASGMTGGT